MSVTAYIALGSNLGDRRQHLDGALEDLRQHPHVQVTKVSSYHETDPVGGPPGQGRYLNAAAELQTDLPPRELMQLLLDIEQRHERVRSVKDAPRTIDLDLLLYGDQAVQEPDLVIPHPRMHERVFVLIPLREIAADVIHPVLRQPVRLLLQEAELQSAPGAYSSMGILRIGLGRELAGLRAVVTGSTRGIGRAVALDLLAAGASVVIHGRQAHFDDRAVLPCHQAETRLILADLRDADACRRLVQEAWDIWGTIDIWINNAGADILTGEAARWSFDKKLAELWAVDVQATILLSREIGARMKAAGRGVILNMGWDQADTGMEGDSGQLFAASKAAVMAFSKSLALTLAPAVRVNCLAPGWIRTAWGEKASTPWQERVRRETPLGRWGTPEDVAAVARWLCSPAASYLTGQVIRVNGGAVR